MDRGAWQAAVHGVTKSWTRLNDLHTHTHTAAVHGVAKSWTRLSDLNTHTHESVLHPLCHIAQNLDGMKSCH